LYNPVTKNFFVSRDVKFLEEKYWSDQENETMENQNPLLQIYEQVESLGKQVPPPRLPRMHVQRQEEQNENISSSNSESVGSMRNYKTRSLRKIHEQLDEMDQQAHFALLSYQTTYF
jgi:hypothetical protein